MPAAEVFLDSAYAIALASVNDQHHAIALALADRIESAGARLVTTRAVLLEIGNALARQRYRSAASELLTAIEEDPDVVIVPLSEELYLQALHTFTERPDHDWGLTDCVSFAVMQARGLTDALTSDQHFAQAGFVPLMR